MSTFYIIKKVFFNKYILKKVIAYLILIIFFLVFIDFLLIFFLTFIFAYLFYTLWGFIKSKIDFLIDKYVRRNKCKIILKKIFSFNIIIWILYLWFISFLIYTLITLPQKLSVELSNFAQEFPIYKEYIQQINQKIIELRNIWTELWKSFNDIITKQDLDLLYNIFDTAKVFILIAFKIILSLVLSYVFIVDRFKLTFYLSSIKESNFGFLYNEYKAILEKIVKTFWAAFKAQSFIAFANSILTTIWLLIIWWFNIWETFPFIYTLALIVFICWFIPIIGLFISSIPIFIIGFTMVWWLSVVIQIIILLIIINLIETYYLNPKIVSSFINLPISLTFVVLIVSEHFLWFAWLIIGIWLFYLIIEILKEANIFIDKSKEKINAIKKVQDETKNDIFKNIRLSRKI